MRPFRRGIYWRDFLSPRRGATPSERVGERTRELDLVLARASRSRARFLSSSPSAPPRLADALASRPSALARARARYLLLSLNILHFIYGCPSRFIAVRAALFALTCFNVVCFFLSRTRLDPSNAIPFSSFFSFFLLDSSRCPPAHHIFTVSLSTHESG